MVKAQCKREDKVDKDKMKNSGENGEHKNESIKEMRKKCCIVWEWKSFEGTKLRFNKIPFGLVDMQSHWQNGLKYCRFKKIEEFKVLDQRSCYFNSNIALLTTHMGGFLLNYKNTIHKKYVLVVQSMQRKCIFVIV